MKKKMALLFFGLVLFTACNPFQGIPKPEDTPTPVNESNPTLTPDEIVRSKAEKIIVALKNEDMATLSEYTHPVMGLRFSPYAFVGKDDLVFQKEQLPNLFAETKIYHWGNYDGSGMPIDLSFELYFEKFVYNKDFANAEKISYNHTVGRGNTLNNLAEFYPGASFVEYHFSGFDPQYSGLDWQSLRLVFLPDGNDWFLVGIIHDQWTV